MQYPPAQQRKQESREASSTLASQLETYLTPLLIKLDALIDKRLVRTFHGVIQAILTFRHQARRTAPK